MFVEHLAVGPPIQSGTRASTSLALRSAIKFALEAKILEKPPVLMDLPKRAKRVPTATSVVDMATCIEAAICDKHRMLASRPDSGGPAPALADYLACVPRGAS